jgi:hypothetical protein
LSVQRQESNELQNNQGAFGTSKTLIRVAPVVVEARREFFFGVTSPNATPTFSALVDDKGL